MSSAVTVGNDLKDYLSAKNSDKPSLTSNISNLFSANKAKQWFYRPLNTEESSNAINGDISGDIDDNSRRPSAKSWLSSLSFSSNTQSESNWLPSLSRTQRLIGFISFILMGLLCFALSSFYIPVLILKARKFSLLFTLGSLFIVLSFSILWGPISHLKHLFSKERLPFTLTYFGSLFATLYFALKIQSTLLTTVFAIVQVIALIWYVVSYLPGGQTGLMFITKAAVKTLPV